MDLQQQNAEIDRKQNEIEKETHRLNAEKDEIMVQCDELKAERQHLRLKCNEMEMQVKNFQAGFNDLQAYGSVLLADFTKSEAERVRFQTTTELLQEALDTKESELKSVRSQLDLVRTMYKHKCRE